MRANSVRRGDTIIEVLLAFTIFAAIAISVTTLMNRSLASAQRSLEVTLVRQQVDSQADLLRYVRDNDPAIWSSIKNNLAANPGSSTFDTCPAPADLPSGAFFLVPLVSPSGAVTAERVVTTSRYSKASYIASVDFTAKRSSGLWITAVKVDGSPGGVPAYDMHIRTCWDTVAQNVPISVSTIVRLYET